MEAEKLIGNGGAARANKHGHNYLSLTYPTPMGTAPGVVKQVNTFSSDEDMVEAVRASTYIPMWSGPKMTIK